MTKHFCPDCQEIDLEVRVNCDNQDEMEVLGNNQSPFGHNILLKGEK